MLRGAAGDWTRADCARPDRGAQGGDDRRFCDFVRLFDFVSLLPLAGAWRGDLFPWDRVVRPVYFTILISHTVLAVVIVPLVLITLTRGLK
jgi:hypothetical protein